jgi:vacuolar-type H+-ATPase subunit H
MNINIDIDRDINRDELGRIVREAYKKAIEEVTEIESSMPNWDDCFLDETKSELHEQSKEIFRRVGEYILKKINKLNS